MGTKEEIEALEARKIELRATMKESDDRAAKCSKMALVFADVYPEDYTVYTKARQEYNEIEEKLVPLYEKLKKEEESQTIKHKEEEL